MLQHLSPSLFSYTISWLNLPPGIGQCFFVIMTELAKRSYIPWSFRQSSKTIGISFCNSFIEILNVEMPCLDKSMQDLGGKMYGKPGCLMICRHIVQNVTRRLHLMLKGLKEKVLNFLPFLWRHDQTTHNLIIFFCTEWTVWESKEWDSWWSHKFDSGHPKALVQ